jgi:hypothetical protein
MFILGMPVPVTWTRLAATAAQGTNTLTLQNAVTWQAGNLIAIATTGDHHSQSQNEKHTIASVSGDGLTLTLTEPLAHDHLGVTGSFDSGTVNVEFRAEVGLLSHNVVVRGSQDIQWDDQIKACPEGFDTGKNTIVLMYYLKIYTLY